MRSWETPGSQQLPPPENPRRQSQQLQRLSLQSLQKLPAKDATLRGILRSWLALISNIDSHIPCPGVRVRCEGLGQDARNVSKSQSLQQESKSPEQALGALLLNDVRQTLS